MAAEAPVERGAKAPEYLWYCKLEQRRSAGWIGGQNDLFISYRTLSQAGPVLPGRRSAAP